MKERSMGFPARALKITKVSPKPVDNVSPKMVEHMFNRRKKNPVQSPAGSRQKLFGKLSGSVLLYASRASVDIAVNLLRARENVTYGWGGRVDMRGWGCGGGRDRTG